MSASFAAYLSLSSWALTRLPVSPMFASSGSPSIAGLYVRE